MMLAETLMTLSKEKLAALHEEARIRRLTPRANLRRYLAAKLMALATRLEPELVSSAYWPSAARGN